MRYLVLAVVLAAAVSASALEGPAPPDPEPPVGIADAQVAVCPVQDGGGRSTEVAVSSTANGPTRLTLFTDGSAAGTLGTETGATGSAVIPVGDIAAVGNVGSLIELPGPRSAAGVLTRGAASFIAEGCLSVPPATAFLTGGSTVSGDTFALQLINPYAGEAVVTLRVASEAGVESNDRFDSVLVPPRASPIIDFNALVPGRENLSVSVETVVGRAIAVGHQGTPDGASVWNGVTGGQDWFLPVPQGGGVKSLVLATPSAIHVDYSIDLYGPEGLDEGHISGTLPARGSARIDLAEITEDPSGMRIIATGPVVPTLRLGSETGLGTTTASAVVANRWMLPGAGAPEEGSATAVILNASLEESTVQFRPLGEGSVVSETSVPSDSVVEIGLEAADGYLIEASSPVVVLWTARSAAGVVAAVGVPIDDG